MASISLLPMLARAPINEGTHLVPTHAHQRPSPHPVPYMGLSKRQAKLAAEASNKIGARLRLRTRPHQLPYHAGGGSN